MRWAGHVAHMGEKRNAYRILVGKPEGKRPYKDVGRRIILKHVLEKYGRVIWTGFIWLTIGTSGGLLWTQ
jgi:hypothetical protein